MTTAFYVPQDEHYALRWFTPHTEITGICGHGTLAAALVVIKELGESTSDVTFVVPAGDIVRVSEADGVFTLDLPAWPAQQIAPEPAVIDGLGKAPELALAATDVVYVYPSEQDVAELEPDFGAAAVLLMTGLGLIFLGGVRFGQFLLFLVGTLCIMGLLAVSSPYRLARITSFLDPWADPFNSGFQLTQSLIAIGSGGWFGAGLGGSIQKLFYLPEAHTDFMFAIYAEEFGFFGQVVLIGLFGFFALRCFGIAKMALLGQRAFGAYLAYGVGLLISLQATINIGVNMGALPTKGLTLPFISYGGNSILSMSFAVGLVLRVYYECQVGDERKPRRRRAAVRA